MKTLPFRLSVVCFLLLGAVACEDTHTSTAPGALASVRLSAPGSVRSGQGFTIDAGALNIGINGIHNGRITITLPAPLQVSFVDWSPGTSAMFFNGGGATVTWTLNTLDSNSGSTLHINSIGVLPGSAAGMTLTLRAELTADGVSAGEAVTQTHLSLTP